MNRPLTNRTGRVLENRLDRPICLGYRPGTLGDGGGQTTRGSMGSGASRRAEVRIA